MSRSSFDGTVKSNQSLQAIVEADRVTSDRAVAVSLKPHELAQARPYADEINQPALNTLDTSTTASPADKPIMASRPFQISA